MNRKILQINPQKRLWTLEMLQADTLKKDVREDYLTLSGEALCQYLLRRSPEALIIAGGTMPFISGNKVTVGYISPLTGVPHYSFVGGQAAAMLVSLGLDAICFCGENTSQSLPDYVVVSGRAPDITLEFKDSINVPVGQRSAYYSLLQQELGNDSLTGSIFTLGNGARLGYRSANLAVEAIYHAGRGGAGMVFSRFASALVLKGKLPDRSSFIGEDPSFGRDPDSVIMPYIKKNCARLSCKTGGTITKLHATGFKVKGNTLPAMNAQKLGYELADIGAPDILKASRHGKTGCHWCQVDCRHFHWVKADYSPDNRDKLLDDFEPAYALLSMLGLTVPHNTIEAKLKLLSEADNRIFLPIEQMGCDCINIGIGLAALFEGVQKGFIPSGDVPECISKAPGLGSIDAAAQAIDILLTSKATQYPALRMVADGPQALAEKYPQMKDIVFTGGKKTLANAGHCNTIWTFLMPFSRYFGHYAAQIYKIDEKLPPAGSSEQEYKNCFKRVVKRTLQKEFYWILCNVFSQCAFTFVIFSQNGEGEVLSDDDLLVKLLRNYGIKTSRDDLNWFAQRFWAQSMDLKCSCGWSPQSAQDFPFRIYEALSLVLCMAPEKITRLMSILIDEWKVQSRAVMERFGYVAQW